MRGQAHQGDFARYWCGAAISSMGTAVTAVAMPVLVVQHLHASATEVGMVNAAQLVPYALFGLLAGAYVDRWRRKPILVWSSVGRAVALAVVPVLAALGVLHTWMLILALLLFGTFSVFGFAATQSLLPRLVPRSQLVSANARLDQTDSSAQTLGPALGGVLVGLLTAPVAIVVDALSYFIEAFLVAGLRVDELRTAATGANLRTEIGEGLHWTYRHPVLGPLAASTHVWFLANGASMTVLPLLALRSLGFSAAMFGVLLTVFGLATLCGALVASRVGARLGSGRALTYARFFFPVAWIPAVVAGASATGRVTVFVALALIGFAMGIENSNEMGLWQSRTPDNLLGRVNGARRSVNRTIGAIGATGAGVLVGAVGVRTTLMLMIVTFAVAAAVVATSPAGSSLVEE